VSLLPLPSGFSRLLALSSPANRSLVFDRGMDRYQNGREISIPPGGKEAFLKDFCTEYGLRRNRDYDGFVERRDAALKQIGARPVDLRTHSRLVIGLGLPHPIETGFLFDRLTGSVYLPGSSIKGMLRAAARLVGDGELEDDTGFSTGFWTVENRDRLFGPALAPGTVAKTGSLRVFDAFPVQWPRLEVDILTPHFTRYYEKKAVPADWESPSPVPLLTVAEDQVFRFHFASTDQERWEEDWTRLRPLLGTALEWLGIGGKKSSGYGRLAEGDLPERPRPQSVREQEQQEPQNPVLSNVLLQIHKGVATAFRGDKPAAACRPDDLEPELLAILKARKKTVRADVEIVKAGNEARIVRVTKWEAR
jgi:CRISPR type III-B/RAMP module RAMP protein Cmr6